MSDDKKKTLETAIRCLTAQQDLSKEVAMEAMETIISGEAHPAEIGAFMTLLAAKGESSIEIMSLASVLRKWAVKVEIGGPLLDIVGTGGDGHDTINISTSVCTI